jgi:hypothetical protein
MQIKGLYFAIIFTPTINFNLKHDNGRKVKTLVKSIACSNSDPLSFWSSKNTRRNNQAYIHWNFPQMLCIQSSRFQNAPSKLWQPPHFSVKIPSALKRQDLPVPTNCIEPLCIYNSCWLQRALESTAGGRWTFFFTHRNYLGEQVALGRALFNRARPVT